MLGKSGKISRRKGLRVGGERTSGSQPTRGCFGPNFFVKGKLTERRVRS